MPRMIIISALLLLLLSACQRAPLPAPVSPPVPSATPTTPIGDPPAAPTPAGDYPVPEAPPSPESYPSPEAQPKIDPAYPAPQGGALYPPIDGDENLASGPFFIDSIELKPNPSTPAFADVVVSGSLPTPCHQPRARVTPPDNHNTIRIQLYSLVDKDKICSQQLQPFAGAVASLGGFPAGTYKVIVNDEPLGEFQIP